MTVLVSPQVRKTRRMKKSSPTRAWLFWSGESIIIRFNEPWLYISAPGTFEDKFRGPNADNQAWLDVSYDLKMAPTLVIVAHV